MEEIVKNGDIMMRVGSLFHKWIDEIQKEMYKNKGFTSSEKITNLIAKHKKYCDPLKVDIIDATKEEIENANK